jgi:hypothetical protein
VDYHESNGDVKRGWIVGDEKWKTGCPGRMRENVAKILR